jgi:hypothetical protein
MRSLFAWARWALWCCSCWLLLACERTAAPASPPSKPPTLRFYAISSLAGALEPCGCVKDMLGGVDHAAAFLQGQTSDAPNSVVIAAGPLLFMDPALDAEGGTQHLFKAHALAESLRDMGLVAWAPGANDWAAGLPKLRELRDKSGAALLAANLSKPADLSQPTRLVEVGGLKVGLSGVVQLEGLAETEQSDAVASLKNAKQRLDEQGARIRVALLAMPRGQALRALESVPGFQLAVVGKAKDMGEANDAPIPPVVVNGTLVVQAPNHLQAIGVVDFFVRGDSYEFQDGSGIAEAERRASLEERISDLKRRLSMWERQGSAVGAGDLAARRRDLKKLEAELARLAQPSVPEKGSFFRYRLQEVREKLGSEVRVRGRLDGYYKRVNEHNREAFKDRRPEPVAANQSGFVGVEQCTACHAEERAFWDRTGHAKAYATLAKAHKQFNLDCVGCHVTGYEKPGGSTVTHVSELTSVQCEACHGPGSRHTKAPSDPALIVKNPPKSLCAPECHHPPHVKSDWNVEQAWKGILGPGHGG